MSEHDLLIEALERDFRESEAALKRAANAFNAIRRKLDDAYAAAFREATGLEKGIAVVVTYEFQQYKRTMHHWTHFSGGWRIGDVLCINAIHYHQKLVTVGSLDRSDGTEIPFQMALNMRAAYLQMRGIHEV